MRRVVDLFSPAIGASGAVIAYGHWGRPVPGVPVGGRPGRRLRGERHGGRRGRPARRGAGRLYCVDSYDARSWSNRSLPLEERARRHGAYESWILDQVVPFVHGDCGGPLGVLTTGVSMGAFHAANFALRRADQFAGPVPVGQLRPEHTWHGWGEQGEALYFQNPTAYVANLHGDHLEWRRRVHLTLVCGQGMWEDTTGALTSTRALAGLLAGKGIPHEARRVEVRRGARLAVVAAPAPPPPAPDGLTEREMKRHLIGLLLGTEEDWPAAFETIVRRMGAIRTGEGDEHAFDVERITIEPFDLRDKPRYDLVIDRLAYWYYVPREWLKKIALMDDVYLLNSPFTFQSMEKHAAYCAMMRLGLKCPTRSSCRSRTRRTTPVGLHRLPVQPAVRS